jgi:hypothetical protein
MSRNVTIWDNPGQIPLPAYRDPRTPIAFHIGWIKTYAKDIIFSLPEPDNYNRAVCCLRPVECKFINDQVFYRDLTTNLWWTVLYVPEDQINQFDAWVLQQNYLLSWSVQRATRIREQQGLLYARKNSDITVNERLFQMGYYAKLRDKYFALNDKMLLERLGPARAEVIGLEEV